MFDFFGTTCAGSLRESFRSCSFATIFTTDPFFWCRTRATSLSYVFRILESSFAVWGLTRAGVVPD